MNNEGRRPEVVNYQGSGVAKLRRDLAYKDARAVMREGMESSQSCLHELWTLYGFSRSAATMPEWNSGIWAAREAMSRAIQNVLAQISAYMAYAHNEQRRERRVYGTD